MKLTAPQLALLKECADKPRSVVDFFPPAKSLVNKGMCVWQNAGHPNYKLAITQAGKEFLK